MEQYIKEFRGENYFLSNFYQAQVFYEGIAYDNSEAAFQASKSFNPKVRKTFQYNSGSTAKRRGKRVVLRPDWESVKLKIMREICYAKFTQNPELKQKLLQTGNCILVESNDWGDTYWGVCNGSGENHLGKILMDIRDELKK